MLDEKDIAEMSETLRGLLAQKFGIKRTDLSQALSRAGRRLPGRVRKQAQVVVEAERLAVHPKLLRQVDVPAVQRAYRDVMAHLKAIDVAERRKDRLLALAGIVAFNVLAILAVFIWWLWWRGYV